jgi:hypothetical protein
MKRALAFLTVATLVASPAVAEAAKKKPVPTKRTVTWAYQGVFGAYTSAVGGGGVCGANPDACFDVPTTKGEKTVKFAAVDASGQKIAVQWTLDGDYNNSTVACGTGEIPVSKGSTVNFYLVAGADCPGGIATQGTMSITVTGTK